MSDENKRLVRESTEVIWNRRGLDRIPEFYAPDFVADNRPYAPLREGHKGIRAMVERAWAAFPDYHEELHELIAEGDHVVARFTISGTQEGQWGPLPPTGRRAEFEEIVIRKIRDGKVHRQRGIVDNLQHCANSASCRRRHRDGHLHTINRRERGWRCPAGGPCAGRATPRRSRRCLGSRSPCPGARSSTP